MAYGAEAEGKNEVPDMDESTAVTAMDTGVIHRVHSAALSSVHSATVAHLPRYAPFGVLSLPSSPVRTEEDVERLRSLPLEAASYHGLGPLPRAEGTGLDCSPDVGEDTEESSAQALNGAHFGGSQGSFSCASSSMRFNRPSLTFEDEAAVEQLDGMLRAQRFNDWPCTMLFLVQLALVVIMLALGIFLQASQGYLEFLTSKDFLNDVLVPFLEILGGSTVCGFAAGIFTLLWLALLKRFTRATILASYVTSVFLVTASAMQSFLTGYIFVGIVIVIVIVLITVLGVVLAKKIAFTVTLLRIGMVLVELLPGTSNFALVSMLVYIVWVTIWATSLIVTIQYDAFNGYLSVQVLFSTLYIISLTWTTLVVKNTVHTTACGAFATWYFMQNSPFFPRNCTFDAFRRSVTYSFGSICFGSFLSAIVTTVRFATAGPWTDCKIFCSSLLVCTAGVQWIARYSNRYTLCYAAIYGNSYVESWKCMVQLMKQNGLDAVLNDTAVGGIMLIAALCAGIIAGAVGLAIGLLFTLEAAKLVLFIVLTALVGFAVNFILLALMISAISTIFVCVSEQPEVLRDSFPELYNRLSEAYNDANIRRQAKKDERAPLLPSNNAVEESTV